MDPFITFIAGVAFGSAFWISVIRRAAKKPAGNTAKLIAMLST